VACSCSLTRGVEKRAFRTEGRDPRSSVSCAAVTLQATRERHGMSVARFPGER
jgi:hypothetical protein